MSWVIYDELIELDLDNLKEVLRVTKEIIKDREKKMRCEICNKEKEDVRFEGSEEMNICDRCLQEKKNA